MKEIEILVQVFADEQTVLQKLSSFEFVGDKHTVDTYYYDPLRTDLCPDHGGRLCACFRTRQKDGINYITYKKDHFDGDTWLYSEELETTVGDMTILTGIINALGLRELVKIDNLKRTYRASDYMIEFETVTNLGLFLEVEYCTADDVDVAHIKSQIQSFIDALGFSVSPELNAGKPELMLRKQQGL